MGMGNKLTDAPCIFCGYSGPEYYQRGSHAEDCPWHSIGGGYERVAAISDVARGMFVELRRLRAELARLKPLAEAAVAWMASNSDESLDASTRLKLAAASYARAQAQAGEGA